MNRDGNAATTRLRITDLMPRPKAPSLEITVEEMAADFGRTPATIRRMLHEGTIPHDKRGRRYVVRRAVWTAWLSGERQQDALGEANAIAAAIRAVLDGKVRVVVTFEPVGR